MKFRTAYKTEGKKRTSKPGSRYEEVREWKYNTDGTKSLVVVGTRDVQEPIQEAYEGTKIENIMRRTVLGDTTFLTNKGVYADISEAPMTLMEMQNHIIAATREFDELPKEIKNKFDNDVNNYIAQYGSEEFLNIMDPKKEEGGTGEPVTENE